MATTKNITMKQFNGTDYDTLYPKTIAEQVDGVYSQDEVLSNSTKALYGLTDSAVPDNVLALLAKCIQHWWKRRAWTEHYSAELSSGANQYCLGGGSTSTASNTIYYSDSIALDADGNTILVNEKSVSVSYSNGTSAAVQSLIGKYIRNAKESLPSSSSLPNTILYIDPSATITSSTGSGDSRYGVYISSQGAKKAVAVLAPIVGEWEYIQSADRSAYPDSGTSGGYEYQYLGVPFDNAVTASKIVTGTYVGTGTYGASNPNSLTFDFEPKFVAIYGNAYGNVIGVSFFKTDSPKDFTWYTDSRLVFYSNVSWNGNTVSWYTTQGNSGYQMNNTSEYNYIAIG